MIRKLLFFSVLICLTFITMTVGMRWEHKFEVCSGDLIPKDYYAQMEQYNYKIPNFYFRQTGSFMKIFSFAYIGTFTGIVMLGFLVTLWVTYRTTYKDDRLPYDP